jgi:hypothetical protein
MEMRMKTVAKTPRRRGTSNGSIVSTHSVHEAQRECRRRPRSTPDRLFPVVRASLQLSSASAAASMRPETARPTPLDPTLTGSKIKVYRARKLRGQRPPRVAGGVADELERHRLISRIWNQKADFGDPSLDGPDAGRQATGNLVDGNAQAA